MKLPVWNSRIEPELCADENRWTQPRENLFYNPRRSSEPVMKEALLELCSKYMRQMPVKVVQSNGYLSTMFEAEDQITVQFLAEDYDVDIDHELDSIRYHRSRVNLVNKVEPIGIDGILKMETDKIPQVYTPFNQEEAKVEYADGICTVTLPEKCSYAVLRFVK